MGELCEELRLFTTNGGSRTRVDVSGEIDLSSADLLRDHLAMIIESGTGDVELDMSAVSFCDSTGMSTLITARHQLQARDRQLRVVNPSNRVSRTLQLAGVCDLLGLPVSTHRE
jgi:anti-sigma B factor antagonist